MIKQVFNLKAGDIWCWGMCKLAAFLGKSQAILVNWCFLLRRRFQALI